MTREIDGVTRALLIQRGHEPYAGMWQIPGGYAEYDELLSTAVVREVREETGVVADVADIIGVRHALGGYQDGPSTNVYVVFRLEYRSGEPRRDAEGEAARVGFFSLSQMKALDGLQGLTRWSVEQALRWEAGRGLRACAIDERSDTDHWALYGLGNG